MVKVKWVKDESDILLYVGILIFAKIKPIPENQLLTDESKFSCEWNVDHFESFVDSSVDECIKKADKQLIRWLTNFFENSDIKFESVEINYDI